MAPIKTPVKPFPNYKWRWAIVTPTESLNSPPIFLGVLRVFNRYNNYAPSSREVMDALAVVQEETKSKVDLVRTQERNLIRNSGQYWKALGLLEEAHGKIQVSPFGQLLASGKITQIEFATTIVKTLELPNKRIENGFEWEKASLKIKPLELILDILANISSEYGTKEAYVTRNELVKIIIPMAGARAMLADYTEAIIAYRQNKLDLTNWPDCAPSSNDIRMAREFLLFLSNYGFCQLSTIGVGHEAERFYLSSITKEDIVDLHRFSSKSMELDKVVKEIRETQIPANVERKKVSREILERPYQAVFRKNVLTAYNSKCIITGVTIENVLEAAHIKDVQYNGSDKIENGLCLRSDIHQLFDSKHLRILSSGSIILSDIAAARENYPDIPHKIVIPDFVNKENLDWRSKYT